MQVQFKTSSGLPDLYRRCNPGGFLWTPQGPVKRYLTNPHVAVGNGGYDNANQDLILAVGDVLTSESGKRRGHRAHWALIACFPLFAHQGTDRTHSSARGAKHAIAIDAERLMRVGKRPVVTRWPRSRSYNRYIVRDLLGQGTFGQVVKCLQEDISELVAVKVIKNHPAYYHQVRKGSTDRSSRARAIGLNEDRTLCE